MPTSKFTSNTSLSLPFLQFSVKPFPAHIQKKLGLFRHDPRDSDVKLKPDLSTLSAVPGETDPTAQIVCDVVDAKGEPICYSPRHVLLQDM